jgi:hypothetical protein
MRVFFECDKIFFQWFFILPEFLRLFSCEVILCQKCLRNYPAYLILIQLETTSGKNEGVFCSFFPLKSWLYVIKKNQFAYQKKRGYFTVCDP